MATELEGEVASPLARFCTATRWLTIGVTIMLVAHMGAVFSLLMWHQEQTRATLGVIDLLPAALTMSAFVLSFFAYNAEKRAEGNESDSAKSLLMVLLGIFVFLLVFFFFILLTT